MERIKIDKNIADIILKGLNDTVSAGTSTPETSQWYTIRSIKLKYIHRLKRDYNDMAAFSDVSRNIHADMMSNPIGTLIFPTIILKKFDFARITPPDARAICSMIRRQPTKLDGAIYEPYNEPILIYKLSDIHTTKKLVKALESITDNGEVELANSNVAEFIARSCESIRANQNNK